MSTEYNFIKACWGQPVDRVPVWLMRQAGRYLKQYKEVRAQGGGTFLDLCKDPARAAEVTIQPIDLLDVDAAILFSEILSPARFLRIRFVPPPMLMLWWFPKIWLQRCPMCPLLSNGYG